MDLASRLRAKKPGLEVELLLMGLDGSVETVGAETAAAKH